MGDGGVMRGGGQWRLVDVNLLALDLLARSSLAVQEVLVEVA
jgi:hypothetical protein